MLNSWDTRKTHIGGTGKGNKKGALAPLLQTTQPYQAMPGLFAMFLTVGMFSLRALMVFSLLR